MVLKEFLVELKRLHDLAALGLPPADLRRYELAREDLAAALLHGQQLTLKQGETARGAIRVARMLPLELAVGEKRITGVTLDVSSTGFAVVLASSSADMPGFISFDIRLPTGRRVRGLGRATNVVPQSAHVRIGFQITSISDVDREALTRVIFDEVLTKLLEGKSPTVDRSP